MHIINTSLELIYLLMFKPERCIDGGIVLGSEIFVNDNKFIIRLREKVEKLDGYTIDYVYFSFTQKPDQMIFDGSSIY